MNSNISREFNFFSLLKFTLPTIIMMVIMGLYTTVDIVFVSRFVGANALSAVNIVFPITSMVLAISIMFASGGSAIISRKLGAGDRDGANRDFSLITVVGLIVTIIFAIITIVFMRQIIYGLGATDLLYDYAHDYLLIMTIMSPFFTLQILFQLFFVVDGKPALGLTLTIIAGIANAILDYVFIVHLNMGISGAALATGVGYMIPSIAGLIYFTCIRRGSIKFVKFNVDFSVIKETCINGSSEMVTNLATAVTTFLFNIIAIKYLGEDGVAAVTILLNTQFMISSVFIGFSMGVAPVISYNYGSENINQLKRVFKICIIFITLSSVLMLGVSMGLSEHIVAIFTQPNTNVYKIAIYALPIFSINFLFAGINIYSSALFTAFSNGKVSSIISIVRTLFCIVIALLILPLILSETGIWIAVPFAEFVALFVSIFYMYKYKNIYNY